MRPLFYCFLCLCFVVFVAIQTELSGQEPESSTEVAYDLDWRPDGLVLAVVTSYHLWLLDSQFQLMGAYAYPSFLDGITQMPRAVEWSPDGLRIAAIFHGGWLRVWSYPAGDLIFEDRLTERKDPDTIRWHPNQPLLSTYRQIVNVQSGEVEQPFTYDIRSGDDPPREQGFTGKVFWSPDGLHLIRPVSEANCGPCSEYGVFDVVSEVLVQSLGTRSGAWDSFIWSNDGRYRMLDHVLRNDLLFDSEIERVVYVETGYYESYRMPAMIVINTFEDLDIVNHQIVYPISLTHIDWKPEVPYVVTALNCVGEILEIDIRDMSIGKRTTIFAPSPYSPNAEPPCEKSVFPGYTNP